MLRDYQQKAIDQLYAWFQEGNTGNPCLMLPTGAGKSHIVAALCKDALQQWPETRILMLTHVKELIEQNAEKMRQHWPNAPLGIYSASMGKKQLGEPITFAGVQSVAKRAQELGHIDLVVIDECHMVSHKDEGSYRMLLNALLAINPNMRVVGLTATPYRLGHGMITDKPALFDALITPVTIEELIGLGYLSTLRSKLTKAKQSTEGVHKRGGEYIESELQAAVDTNDQNQAIVAECIRMAGDRKAWLFFCAGVVHAHHVKDVLIEHGIVAECITGDTSKIERERILTEYKAGKIRALTNANVLTTGFDYPSIDLIAMLRPTMSPGLYVQMAGRGLRIAPDKKDCMVLDFAGVVDTHGPITDVKPPGKKSEGDGEAPIKACEACGELVAISARVCPACGEPFPEIVKPPMVLRNDDIMGLEGEDMEVTAWQWRVHTSKASGKDMLAVTYYGNLSDPPVTEYLAVLHEGYAGTKSMRQLYQYSMQAGIVEGGLNVSNLQDMAENMTNANPPATIEYRKDGKFFRILQRSWK